MRDYKSWLNSFRGTIADYAYYTDFPKVFRNVDEIKIPLNILNSLIGSCDIETDFQKIVSKYPETLKCIPILLAKRESEIKVTDETGQLDFNFDKPNLPISTYVTFMRETGLFDLIKNHLINNLVDYVTGVEVGLDSNGRKNRGGHLMENLVERRLKDYGLIRDKTYFKEMYINEIEKKWGLDLSSISNKGETEKRFDFVVKKTSKVYGIETNFYSSSGSKLNETARSYKTLALETRDLEYFDFIWITDGKGWLSAKNNLKETFDIHKDIYNIADLENGILNKILI